MQYFVMRIQLETNVSLTKKFSQLKTIRASTLTRQLQIVAIHRGTNVLFICIWLLHL